MKRAKPTKTNKVITLKESELRKIKAQCTDEAIQTALGIAFLTLHSLYGFNEEQLEKFQMELEKADEYMSKGIIKIADIKQYMKKDLKFESRLWEV